MDNEIENQTTEEIPSSAESQDSNQVLQEVAALKEAVGDTVEENTLRQNIDDLYGMLDNLGKDVADWKAWRKDDYLGAIETLKSHVEEMQSDWNGVSTSLQSQRERLEALLQSFPGVIETASLKTLALRVTHLEQLVSQLVSESQAKTTALGTRKQMLISIGALLITIIFWGIFIFTK